MAVPSVFKITVCGLLNDVTYHTAKCCAEDLHLKDAETFPEPEITGLLEFEWNLYIEAKKTELQGEAWAFEDRVIVFVNDEFLGGAEAFLKWAETEHAYQNFRPMPLYVTLAEEAYIRHMQSTRHNFVYLDITIGGTPAGRILIELFTDITPRMCENFHHLCIGDRGNSEITDYPLHYKDSIIHRVVPNGWIQGGDIWLKRGNGGESIFGKIFEDESFAVSHTRRGMVGMANNGRHTNGSQFYITLQPAKWMDTKFVAFGQVIEGTQTLKTIEALETLNERPIVPVVVADCGVMHYSF